MKESSFLQWLQTLLTTYSAVTKELNAINQMTLWVASTIYSSIDKAVVAQMVSSVLTEDWQYLIKICNCLDYGECIDAKRELSDNMQERAEMPEKSSTYVIKI